MHNYSLYRQYLRELHWQSDFSGLKPMYRNWLSLKGSLTAALKQKCRKLNVFPVFEGWIVTSQEQQIGFHCDSDKCWLREVVLIGDGQEWIFVRTFIPEYTFAFYSEKIYRLGKMPLGSWLFQQNVQRTEIKWGANHQHYARCSTLSLQQRPFFVSELFLKDFWRKLKYLNV
ncbi:chorismate--pyruvate lyase family protein [Gallibacterium genomosp. 1]|uniref:Chorismate--pyruvate lyase n=1 Tax=Gallibacterium genomosp. 1 TaxID=155515 RepID=A0A0A2XYD9_9PAST|nr:chorismate lyase [Gallibacterium genomosp. 1]KGQ35892.1 chorismate--pyruvate lyase [Gallibacterium genomosp. 1]